MYKLFIAALAVVSALGAPAPQGDAPTPNSLDAWFRDPQAKELPTEDEMYQSFYCIDGPGLVDPFRNLDGMYSWARQFCNPPILKLERDIGIGWVYHIEDSQGGSYQYCEAAFRKIIYECAAKGKGGQWKGNAVQYSIAPKELAGHV